MLAFLYMVNKALSDAVLLLMAVVFFIVWQTLPILILIAGVLHIADWF